MKTVNELSFKDKRVLLRVDFNVPLGDKGEVKDDSRIRAALPTIKLILKQKPKQLILMSHLGSPDGKPDPKLRMDPVCAAFIKILKKNVVKVNDCVDITLPDDKVIMLENLRFHKEEEENIDDFARKLASFADVYVNDAFGVSHRAHASVHAITKFLPGCMGLLLEKELKSLDIGRMEHPIIALIGGAKLKTKIPLIQTMLSKADRVLIGGAMIFTFYAAKNYPVGKSPVEKEYLTNAKIMMNNDALVLPTDLVVAKADGTFSDVMTLSCDNIPEGYAGYDIGEKSVEAFKEELAKAKTIIWNGPMGYFEKKPFDKATSEIAKFIAGLKCNKIVGGGDSVDAINNLKLASKFTFVSSGGGASLELLSGKELPAVRALKDQKF